MLLRSKHVQTTYLFLRFNPLINGNGRRSCAVLESHNGFFDEGYGGHVSKSSKRKVRCCCRGELCAKSVHFDCGVKFAQEEHYQYRAHVDST